MSGYMDGHSTSASPAATSNKLPQPLNTSPYHYANPAADLTHSSYPQDGLPSSQNGNGARQGQEAAYASSANSSLTAALQVGPDTHSAQQHQQPLGHHHGTVTPPLQYASGIHHGPSTSPPGHQGPTLSDSGSPPPNKKTTRIPRACDLCSQRKVKVSCPRSLVGGCEI